MMSLVTNNWEKSRRECRKLTAKAIRNGNIVKPKRCSRCGDIPIPRKLHAHHDDYEKPYEIKWLCCSCHMRLHWKRYHKALKSPTKLTLRAREMSSACTE
jgi:hypothetical protein